MGSVENAEKFANKLRTEFRRIEEDVAPEIVRQLALNAIADLDFYTPRRTGYAKSGWVVTFDAPSSYVPPEGTTKSDKEITDAMVREVEKAPPYPHIIFSNNVEYIEILDAGRKGDFEVMDSPFGEVYAPTRRITGSRRSPNGILEPTFNHMLDSLEFDRTVE